jgi:hypothetical protein
MQVVQVMSAFNTWYMHRQCGAQNTRGGVEPVEGDWWVCMCGRGPDLWSLPSQK